MFLKKLLRDNRGTSAVEFALVSPLFFLIIFGIIDLGRAYWIISSMEYAVEAGGRYAMINSGATGAQIITQAQNNLYAIDQNSVTFTASDTTISGTKYTVVRAQATFYSVPAAIFRGTINLQKQVQVPRL